MAGSANNHLVEDARTMSAVSAAKPTAGRAAAGDPAAR